jgi:hypothetical protein
VFVGRHTVGRACGTSRAKMRDREWISALGDGRRVKFSYQELPNDEAFITAQIERNRVVYSILLAQTEKPLSRAEVESYFEDELSKK